MMAAAALGAALLAGCGGPRYQDVAGTIPVMVPDTGRIYFYQPAAPIGVVSNQPYLRVNGVKVGRSKPGSFFYVNRPAGKYEGATGNAASVGRQDMRLEESEKIAQQEMSPLKYWGAGSRERVKLRP